MSKELKFRVWNEDKNKFMQSGFIGISDGAFIDLKNSSVHFDSDDKIIDQFTGLVDKNGRDIFEGDIVKSETRNNTNTMDFMFKIIYDIEEASYMCVAQNSFFGMRSVEGKSYDIEVVGNIHENMDLLK